MAVHLVLGITYVCRPNAVPVLRETVLQLLRRRVNAQQPGRGVPSSCRESGRHVSLFLAIASV